MSELAHLPRGLLSDVEALLRQLKIKAALRDERFTGSTLPLSFKGELRPEQLLAALIEMQQKIMKTGTLTGRELTALGYVIVAAADVSEHVTEMFAPAQRILGF